MLSKFAIASLFAAIAAASPTMRRAGASRAFQIETLHSGSEVHFRSVVANNGNFYINRETTVQSPPDNPSWYGNETALSPMDGPNGGDFIVVNSLTPTNGTPQRVVVDQLS